MESLLLHLWWRPPPLSSAAFESWLVVCVCLAATVLCLLYAWHWSAYTNKAGKLPPGSLGLPLLGETLHFFFSKSPIGTPQPFFATRVRRYGPISLTHMMGLPTVLTVDPELNKFLLANEEKLVQVYLPQYIQKLLGPLVVLQGPAHRAFRELVSLGVNANAIQKLHLEPVQEYFWECLKSWHQTQASVVVEVFEACRKWPFAYFVKYYLGLEADDPITIALMRDTFLLFRGLSSIPINLPGTTFNKAVKGANRIDSTVRRLIRERKLEARKEEKDFLDYLLKRVDESGDHCNGLPIADLMYAFVLGAFEGSGTLFGNVLKYLSENEHVVDELRRENFAIQKTKTNKEKLTWDDYQNMQFTRNVMKETLRLTSTGFLFRTTRQDVHFKDIVIPKGWLVLIDSSTAHLNSQYYPNPLQFDPWRWTEPARNCLNVLTPFGGGKRRCPGGMIAQFEATILVHYFVTLFKWKRVYKGDKQHDDERDCLSTPTIKGGLFLKIEPLNSEIS